MMLAEWRAAELESWLTQAEYRRLPAFKKMAHAMRQDYAAVKAAFSSEWSNGQARSTGQLLKTSETHRVRQSQF